MKKITPPAAIIFTVGLVFFSIAILAEPLGLDKHPGDWSRIRIVIFITGVLLMLFTGIYFQLIDKLNLIGTRVRSLFYRQRVVMWVSENENMQRALGFISEHVTSTVILVTVLVFYTWLASSGTWTVWKSSTDYYVKLANSFLNGNLYLPFSPDHQLLTLENPYDPSARTGIVFPVDLSFYQEKFYMYWGPIPAAVLLILSLLTKISINDLGVAFTFVCGTFLAQSALLHTIRNRFFPNLPRSFVHFSILLGGLTGLLFLLRHNYEGAKIYEAAIIAGQFFLISGIWIILIAFNKPVTSNWKLTIASTLWICAIGTRLIFAAPIAFIVLLSSFRIIASDNANTKRKTSQLISLGLPFAIGFLVLGLYNWERFGSFTETGMYYQLAGVNVQENYSKLFSSQYIIPNLYNFSSHPPELMKDFPFVFMSKGSQAPLFSFYTVPDFYNAQPITGLIYIFPFLIFSVIPILQVVPHHFKTKSSQKTSSAGQQGLLNWLIIILGGNFIVSFCLLLNYFWTGMRFIGDFIPSLTILSIIGYWQGYYQLQSSKTLIKNLYLLCGAVLAILSIIVCNLLIISTSSGLMNIITSDYSFLR